MKKITFTLLILAYSFLCHANTQQDIGIIEQLYKSGRVIETYELGLALENKLAGNPKFDFYFGMSAIQAGDASRGVYALERVQYSEPNSPKLLFELGKGYYDLEEYPQSKKLFQQVLMTNPPVNVKQLSTQYLNAIKNQERRYTSQWDGYIGFETGINSNVNSATSLKVAKGLRIESFGTLSDKNRAISSPFSQLSAAVNYSKPFHPNWSWSAGVNTSGNHFSKELAQSFQYANAGVKTSLNQKIGKNNTLNYELNYQALYLDTEYKRDIPSIGINWSNRSNKQSQYIALLRYSNANHKKAKDTNSDSSDLSFGVLGSYRFIKQPTLPLITFGLIGNDSQSKKTNSNTLIDKQTLRGVLSTALIFSRNHRGKAEINYTHSAYKNTPSYISYKKRKDQALEASLEYKYNITNNLLLNGRVSYTDNESNIPFYSYDREHFSIGVDYVF